MKIFSNLKDWFNLKLLDSVAGRLLDYLQNRYPHQYVVIISICTTLVAISGNALASLEYACENVFWCWDTGEAVIYSAIFYISLAVGFLTGEKKASDVIKEIDERKKAKKNNAE
jgi:hypothetical protein